MEFQHRYRVAVRSSNQVVEETFAANGQPLWLPGTLPAHAALQNDKTRWLKWIYDVGGPQRFVGASGR